MSHQVKVTAMYYDIFKWIAPALLTLVLVLGVFSCNTDEEPQAGLTGDSSSAISAEISGSEYFSMVEEISLSALQSHNSGGRIATVGDSELTCSRITFNSSSGQGELTIDFGSEGCEGIDGKVKKGKIVISFSGSWEQVGSMASISLVGFSIDGALIEGNWTITGKGITTEALIFETKLTGGKVTWPGGVYVSREAMRTYTVYFNLQNMSNLSIAVEGTASGTTRIGLKYESVITEPLVYKAGCADSQSARIPAEGVLEITSDKTGFTRVIVNFGTGHCDETFTVTMGAFTKEMTPADLESFI